MSSNTALTNANQLVAVRGNALEAFIEPLSLMVMFLLRNRGATPSQLVGRELGLPHSDVERITTLLIANDLICRTDSGFVLTEEARKRLTGSLSLDFLVGSSVSGTSPDVEHPLTTAYLIREAIGRGATSFTFRATQANTNLDRTLKVFLPGCVRFDQLAAAIERRGHIKTTALPGIIDAGQVRLALPGGESAVTPCVVLEYINGQSKTFSAFLRDQANLSPVVFETFVERVCEALAAIEAVGLQHGDLHDGNILVKTGDSPSIAEDFFVIDFIGVPSCYSPQLALRSDIENFRDHLLRAVLIASKQHPGYSVRYLLGDRVYRVLQKLRLNGYASFGQILEDFRKPQVPVPKEHFNTPSPQPFEWLRVEWIPSPQLLIKLFEPVPSRFSTIARFGNTWISGPRGCGKSHYLRVLAFQPQLFSTVDQALEQKLDQLGYDFRRAFGVLFACRLGEFKAFTPEAMREDYFDVATQQFLKHILVLKIWTKTLQTIREGLETTDCSTECPVLEVPSGFGGLIDFLERCLGKIAMVADSSPIDTFLQCLAMCTARENSAIAVWNYPRRRPELRLLDERDLDGFFAVVKQTFPDLADTRFYVLVDDASYGQIHFEMQKVLNSLVRGAHANHVFKITCDKFMYTLDTSDGRAIDPSNEVTYVDLGEISTKSQRETAIDLSEYLARVLDSRLKAADFRHSIKEILGTSQSVREFLSALSQPGARRKNWQARGSGPRPSRQQAYYAGWNIVWSLAHGSVRTLLELVEHIFNSASATPETKGIPLKVQDAAVRSYAKSKFKALFMLPADIKGKPVGQRLQKVISAVGQMSKEYLRHYDTGAPNRWYETISIERLDTSELDARAELLLQDLIKYGLFLDEGVTFSRAQFGLSQRYDLNKIFAPAFQTTYRVRNHIYLGRDRFNELLLTPHAFLARHRTKLRELAIKKKGKRLVQQVLFGGSE